MYGRWNRRTAKPVRHPLGQLLPPGFGRRGQSSFELLVIISFVVLVVTAYLAAFSQEFFPVSALANAKVAAISAASASVRGSCTFYGLEHASLQDNLKIGLSFRALSTGTPCASISRSAISARLGSLPFPYSLNITHETGAGTASSIFIPVTPEFTMSASPSASSIAQGGTASYSLNLIPASGFSASVSLSASGLPSGATVAFSPASVTPAGTSAVAVQTSPATSAGTYAITFIATGGGVARTSTVTLTVTGTPDFTISPSPPSASVAQGASVSYSVSLAPTSGFSSSVSLSASGLPTGATAAFSPSSVTPSGTSTLAVQASPTTPAGTYTVTVSGTGGGITRSSSLSLTVSTSADFAIATSPTSLSVIQGSSNTTAVSLTSTGGFSSSVSLSASGLPAGATAAFSPTAVTPSGTSTLTITTALSTPAGTYTITVSGTGGGITRNSTVVLVIGAGTISPVSTQTSLSGFYNLYSPSVLDYGGVKRMWLGGWLAGADELEPACTLNGADKMYYSELAGTSWTWPAPINWTNPGYTPGKKPCYHINDPTVIKDPTRDVLYMYYTAFPDEYVPMNDYSKHSVGFANSTDGGKTWTDYGIVIAPADSGDGKGAWSPSAIVAGSEIWVYYHTGTTDFSQPINFRTRFDLTGWQKIGAPERLSFSGVAAQPLLVNVDVSRQGSQYVMFADALGGDHLNNITMYVSPDGLNWSSYPPGSNTIIGAGINTALTPNAEILGPDRYAIYFGYATAATNRSDSIQRWEFVIPASASADFAISSASLGVAQGGSNTTDVSLTSTGGFSSPVSLTVSGLPAGATATFSPSSVTPPGTSTLAVQASPTTPAGTYTLTVSGTGGGITRTTTVALAVSEVSDFSIGIIQLASKQPAAEPLRLLGATPIASSVTPGGSVAYNITIDASGGFSSNVALSVLGLPAGATATFGPASLVPPGSSKVNLSTSATTPQGTYTITFTATGGGKTHDITVTLTVSAAAADFTITASPASRTVEALYDEARYTVTLTPQGGFGSQVALGYSGNPAWTIAGSGLSSSTLIPPGTAMLTVTSMSEPIPGVYPITINATGGGKTHGTTVNLNVPGLAASPSTQIIVPGDFAMYTVSLVPRAGFTSSVALSVSGLPAGATYTPVSVSPSSPSVLNIQTTSGTPAGDYPITITGTGGGQTYTGSATLRITTTPCTNVQVNGPTADKVDVVFIACNYPPSQMSQFVTDVNTHKGELLNKPPFSSSQSKFNFYRVDDSTLTCTTVNGLTNTDYAKAMSTAALCPNDQVIMIRYEYGRSSAGGGFAYTVRGSPLTTIHEFGHSFGELWDEYLSTGTDATVGTTSGDIANCDHESTCPKWSGIVGTGCYLGCTFNNWYRPSADSMMNVGMYSNAPFNPPSVNALNDILSNYK